MAERAKKRTPSPRYIAARLLTNVTEAPFFRTKEEISELVESKVSDEKRDKVMKQVEKLTASFNARVKKIIDNFERPPVRRRKPPAV